MENSVSDIKEEELHITDYGNSYQVEDGPISLAGDPGSIEINRTEDIQPPAESRFANTGQLGHDGSNYFNPEIKVKHEWRDDEYFCRINCSVEAPLSVPLEDRVQHETNPVAVSLPVKVEQEDAVDPEDTEDQQVHETETNDGQTYPSARNGCRVKRKSRGCKISDGKIQRCSYTAEFKCGVISFAEKHGNRAAGRKFNINERSVRTWRRQRNALATCPSDTKSFRGPKHGRYPKLEDEVTNFILKLRNEGHKVSFDTIQMKSFEVAIEQGISLDTFRASRGWADNLMKRQGFSLRARSTFQPTFSLNSPEKLQTFQTEVNNLRRAKDYLICQIGCADYTPILLECPSNYSAVCRNGVNEITVASQHGTKQRFTVMLSCTADGCKLQPYIVFKGKAIAPKLVFPKRVVVRANCKGAMNNDLMVDWLKCVWLRRPGTLLSEKSMIVLDPFRGHLTDRVKLILKRNGTDVVTVPRSMTSKLLPLVTMLNKRLRVGIKKRYLEWLCRTDTKKLKRLKGIPMNLIAEWVLALWDAIPGDKVEELFKKCCIINSLNESEDGKTKGLDYKMERSRDGSLPEDEGDTNEKKSSSEVEGIDNNEERSLEDSNSEGSYYDRSSSCADDDS